MAGGAGRPEPAVPLPSRPLAACRPGVRSCSSCPKALATWPEVDWSLTSRSLASGTRTVRSPETLDSSMSRSPDGPRSMAIVPEMVLARTDPPPSATVISPETVDADRSPADGRGLHRPRDRLGLGRAAKAGQGDLAAHHLGQHGPAGRRPSG